MPTYDYLCPNGHRFEVIHSLSADGPTACPICHASPVRKAFSAPTIHFKGSGWAKKDRSTASRSASKAASAAAESGSTADSGGPDSAAAKDKDKGKGAATDGASSTDARPTTDRKASSDSGKTTGSSAGPAVAD